MVPLHPENMFCFKLYFEVWNKTCFRDVKVPWVIDTVFIWAVHLCEHCLSSNEICKALMWIEVLYFLAHKMHFFSWKMWPNSTCVLCAEGKYYFQTYKYSYIYYTTSLLWDSEICFQIMRFGITACERLTFLSGDLPWRIHWITCDSGYLRWCSSKV